MKTSMPARIATPITRSCGSPRPTPPRGFSGEQLMINYNSALKVVNLGEPEASLILRKPRSPQGQGGADASSPTGLSHVGGPRWESTEHPAYRAILDWIREASSSAAAQAGTEKLSADSYAPELRAGPGRRRRPRARSGTPSLSVRRPDIRTSWSLISVPRGSVEGLLYVPRQDSPNGRVKDFEVRVSDDGKTWSAPLATGRWNNDPSFKHVALPGSLARYVQLRGLSEVEGRPFMSAAEVSVDTTAATSAGPTETVAPSAGLPEKHPATHAHVSQTDTTAH